MTASFSRHRAALLVLAGLTACVAVPDPDLTVRGSTDAASSPRDGAPLGGQAGDLAELGGRPGADLDPIPDPPRDAGAVEGDTRTVAPDADEHGGPRLAEQNEFGPAARVVALEMPANATEADALGCRVAGRERGSILYGAFHFAMRELTSYVTPDEDGVIEMTLLARMPDWQAGVRVRELGTVGLGLDEGARGADLEHFSVRGGSTSAAFDPFPVAADGTFETAPETISVQLPLLYGGQTVFEMQNATLRGALRVDGPGFAVQDARLEGYYTRDGVAGSIRDMDATCRSSTPEAWCSDFRLIVPPGGCQPFGDPGTCDLLIDALALFVGGFDARVEPGVVPDACDSRNSPDCNAVAVCLSLEMTGVVITGRAP
jgi:hypothetical protein